MNQPLPRHHFSSHPQESRQVCQTSRVLLHTIRGNVALLGAVALLVATIISSCGGSGWSTSTSTPTLTPISSIPTNPLVIFQGGYTPEYVPGLAPGYDIGASTSGGLTNWVDEVPIEDHSGYSSAQIDMNYPSGQSWGAAFITVGKPTQPPRPGKDFSNYTQLSLELGGQAGGESVSIGIKDNTQPDDGSETKVSVSLPSVREGMKTFTFPLSDFTGADLHKLYVVIEFVFTGGTPETVWVGDIQYLL
jgi:hypothetical protein